MVSNTGRLIQTVAEEGRYYETESVIFSLPKYIEIEFTSIPGQCPLPRAPYWGTTGSIPLRTHPTSALKENPWLRILVIIHVVGYLKTSLFLWTFFKNRAYPFSASLTLSIATLLRRPWMRHCWSLATCCGRTRDRWCCRCERGILCRQDLCHTCSKRNSRCASDGFQTTRNEFLQLPDLQPYTHTGR